MIRKLVYARFTFEGFHKWPEAPAHVRYLANLHRHIFHVKVSLFVTDSNREIEFITLGKRAKEVVLRAHKEQDTTNWSCEHWAEYLLMGLNACEVEVSEDGENGAIVFQDES